MLTVLHLEPVLRTAPALTPAFTTLSTNGSNGDLPIPFRTILTPYTYTVPCEHMFEKVLGTRTPSQFVSLKVSL